MMKNENRVIPKVIVNSSKPVNNIVSGQKLKEIQSSVLNDLKEAIINSMGPAGSNSLILRGSSDQDIVAEYSKDGNKIIKSIKYQYPIEMAIKSEIENSTRYIEKTVGDGTSSIVVMSSLIFDALYDNYKGAICFVRVKEGVIRPGMKMRLMATGGEFDVVEVGTFHPGYSPCDALFPGDVGYVAASIKDVRDTRVGDTITDAARPAIP